MAKIGGIIAGAIGGAAGVIGEQAKAGLEDERKLELAGRLSQIDELRQKRIAEHNADLQVRTAAKVRDDTLAHETNPDTIKAKLGAVEQTAEGTVAIDEKLAPRKQALAAGQVSAEEKARREAVIASGSDPKYLAALAAVAKASKPPESAATAAEAALRNFELRQKQAAVADLDALMKATEAGDTAAANAARKRIALRVEVTQDAGVRPSDKVKAADVYMGLAKTAQAELASTDFLTLPADEQAARRAEIMADVAKYKAMAEAGAAAVLDPSTAGKTPKPGAGAPKTPAAGEKPPLRDVLFPKANAPAAPTKQALYGSAPARGGLIDQAVAK